MNWNNANDNTISKDEAKTRIDALASDEGIRGAFKVFYDGTLMVTPEDLPERVDMSKVRVSAVLDQA